MTLTPDQMALLQTMANNHRGVRDLYTEALEAALGAAEKLAKLEEGLGEEYMAAVLESVKS